MLVAVVQRLYELLQRRVESGQICGWLKEQSIWVSPAVRCLALYLIRSVIHKERVQNLPIRIFALVVPQIIQIDNEPHLLIIQHAADRLAVVVIGVSLYCQCATPLLRRVLLYEW